MSNLMCKIQKISLVFLSVFSVLHAQFTEEQILEKIRWDGSPEIVAYIVGAGAALAIIFIIITHNAQKSSKEKYMRDFIDAQFVEKSKEAKLNVAEQTMLKSITWVVAPKMLSDVFNSLVIFEEAVDMKIRKTIEMCPDDPKRANDAADIIFVIRRKLGFDELVPEKPIASTRNIGRETAVSLLTPLGETPFGSGKVTSVNELCFEVELEKSDNPVPKNIQKIGAIVKFTRAQDAVYSAHVDVHSVSPEKNQISFYHTTSLERSQSRQHLRLSIDMPLQCRIIKRTDEKAKPSAGEYLKGAMLLDISGGGLAFTSKISLSVDDIALFSFALQKQKMVVKGKIVAILQQEGKSGIYFKHRVVFYGAKPVDNERIIKFIYEKQRERMQLG